MEEINEALKYLTKGDLIRIRYSPDGFSQVQEVLAEYLDYNLDEGCMSVGRIFVQHGIRPNFVPLLVEFYKIKGLERLVPKQIYNPTPKERLEIAVNSRDQDVLLKEALNYVRDKVIGKYPRAQIEKNLADSFMGFFPTYNYHLVETTPSIQPALSFWTGEPKMDHRTGQPITRTVYNNKILIRAKRFDFSENWYPSLLTLLVEEKDPNLYSVCEEVTNLTNGRIKSY